MPDIARRGVIPANGLVNAVEAARQEIGAGDSTGRGHHTGALRRERRSRLMLALTLIGPRSDRRVAEARSLESRGCKS